MAGLKTVLEKHFNRGFSHQYISKISDKVAREGLIDAERTKLEERMQFTRENYRMMGEELLKIVYWKDGDPTPEPLARDKVGGAKNVVMLDLAILNAEAAAGMYKKPIEEFAKAVHYEPVPASCARSSSQRGRAGDCCRERLLSRWCRSGQQPQEAEMADKDWARGRGEASYLSNLKITTEFLDTDYDIVNENLTRGETRLLRVFY